MNFSIPLFSDPWLTGSLLQGSKKKFYSYFSNKPGSLANSWEGFCSFMHTSLLNNEASPGSGHL